MPELHDRPAGGGAAALVGAVLLIVGLAAALSIDVIPAGYGVKSDEATYVGMTLSLAYDHDLAYQRRDLDRFWGLYKTGPEGVFLKTGKSLRIRLNSTLPFLHVTKLPDPQPDRLFWGKAFIYSVFAAPFVRILGMNGFLVFHVLLLFLVCTCGYLFLRARSPSGPALAFTLAFVGAAVVPVYGVFLMPDLFNFSLVFVAYFFWLYKEVAPTRNPWLCDERSTIIAAILLGLATYSKPPNAALMVPLVLLPWWRKQWKHGLIVGVVFAVVGGGLFGVNALITGEFNYQGGDRKTFYGSFPFDSTRDVWNANDTHSATDDADTANVLAPSEFAGRFARNVEYFFIGRHFGFVPYFFPGVIALLAWAFARDRFRAWRTLTLLAIVAATTFWMVIAPYSWSGGGGPPGNRYFLNIYPLVFFLMPPIQSSGAAILAWAGGALFTAKILVSPFDAAKRTWEIAEHGPLRRLPVEMTMVQDLPAMLAQPLRGLIHYRADPLRDPLLELSFLDSHAYPPEPVEVPGEQPDRRMWVSGAGRADIIVKTEEPVHHFAMTAFSPISTVLTISAGAATSTIPIVAGKTVTFELPASGVRGFESYECLLSAQSSEGFIPHLQDPNSQDPRNLGVLLKFKAE